MKFFGYPDKIIYLLQAFYKSSQSSVRVNGELTDWFQTTVGVRQGRVLPPQLYKILLDLTILYATQDTSAGVNIQGQQINNLRFANDIVLLVESTQDLQAHVDRVYQKTALMLE